MMWGQGVPGHDEGAGVNGAGGGGVDDGGRGRGKRERGVTGGEGGTGAMGERERRRVGRQCSDTAEQSCATTADDATAGRAAGLIAVHGTPHYPS